MSSTLKPATGLRLMVFDDTCRGSKYPLGLTHSWISGSALYRAFGQLDYARGVTSWQEGLRWIEETYPDEPIEEIQFWGHGKWGKMMVDRDAFDATTLAPTHPYGRSLDAIAERMTPESRFWIRTCETFGGTAGHDFSQRLSDRLQCTVAGHTYIIGPWQSGLRILRPGEKPNWSAHEGIKIGTPDAPLKAFWSQPSAPRTVTCLRMRIPKRWLIDGDGDVVGGSDHELGRP